MRISLKRGYRATCLAFFPNPEPSRPRAIPALLPRATRVMSSPSRRTRRVRVRFARLAQARRRTAATVPMSRVKIGRASRVSSSCQRFKVTE